MMVDLKVKQYSVKCNLRQQLCTIDKRTTKIQMSLIKMTRNTVALFSTDMGYQVPVNKCDFNHTSVALVFYTRVMWGKKKISVIENSWVELVK